MNHPDMTGNATSLTILQGWRRACRPLCTAMFGLGLALTPIAASAAETQLVLWAWERREDLRFAPETEVAVQAGFIELTGDHVVSRARSFPLHARAADVTTSVVHIQIEHRRPLIWSERNRVLLARKVLELARPGRYRRVQIDFEVRSSERQILLDLLHDVRAGLPPGVLLSMTALASWCDTETWLAAAPVDEIVPMLFRMGDDARALKARLARGGDFGEARCRTAYAISTDAPLARAPAGRRVYLFSPKSWTAGEFAAVKGRVASWRVGSH